MRAEARFHEGKVGAIYGRYKRFGSTEMEESSFPVPWAEYNCLSSCDAGRAIP